MLRQRSRSTRSTPIPIPTFALTSTRKKLQGLVATAEVIGIRQSIEVRPKGNGRVELVAGARRYIAAKRAGLKEVPITIGEGSTHLSKVIENLQREDLDPIDTGRAFQMLKGELNLKTNKQLADRIGIDQKAIGEHLRLLVLPDAVQGYFARKVVPIEAERLLRDIAKASPQVAECICELAERRKYKGRYLIDHFAQVATEKFKKRPTMIPVVRAHVSEMVQGRKARAALADRINAYETQWRQGPNPFVPLTEARRRRRSSIRVPGRAHDGAPGLRHYDGVHHRRESRCRPRQPGGGTGREGGSRSSCQQDAAKAEKLEAGKERRKSDRVTAKETKAAAECFNEELSGSLFKHRTPANRKRQSMARLRAMAEILVADNPKLAARGLRLVLPGLQEVEVTTLKSGKEKRKVTTPTRRCAAPSCCTALRRRARSRKVSRS